MGSDRYGEMFPGQKDRDRWLGWERFKIAHFQQLLAAQDRTSGARTQGDVGPVFVTGVNLCLFQLDEGIPPIYQR
ncbi:hypothetical protein [Gemmata sp. SH-PL17]|uniref:hypothetical protein n=1 Tax=Gemmata sp. SH-PL17 TaxID=1630693 RepID=UPI000698D5F5|nr:hypothetical protein [Gemmata sp. SH-PL17]